MKIRSAKVYDSNDINLFYNQLIDQMNQTGYETAWRKNIYPDESLIAEFIHEDSMYVGVENDRIISAMALNSIGNEAYDQVKWTVDADACEVLVIHILGVYLTEKGKGHGKEMINYAVDYAKITGKKVIRMDVHITNTTAMKLYEKMGFQAVGNVKMIYDGIGIHEFVMYEWAVI